MSKIPCRKCKKCGKYSDFASLICVCGEDISGIPGALVELSDLSDDMIGKIDEDFDVYVQKCSACGALNFTLSEDKPVRMCCNCHKTRIAAVVPVKYSSEEKADSSSDAESETESVFVAQNSITDNAVFKNAMAEKSNIEDEDDDDDDDASQWVNMLSGIKSATGNAVSPSEALTIDAVRYGKFSYTIKKQEVPFLLGRDANLKEFLANDPRVSNEHCYIDYENGDWFVRDNNSSNGTAVNSRDIGYGGQKLINDGDLLKLGHHPDSMEFKVMIG